MMGSQIRWSAAAMAIAVAACSPTGGPSMSKAATGAMEMASDAPAAEAPAPAPAAGGDAAPQAASAPRLAYAYAAEIEAPAAAVEPMMRAHAEACRAAGPARCNVLAASSNAYGDDRVNAQLSLRAEPTWLATFRGGLEGQAEAARGRVTSNSVTAEDLTRQLIDVEARLRAQKTLRDRLQQMLRERPGKLADLLETERELARVQGEIDSFESTLAVMRQRVEMSTMDLSYRSAPTAITGGTFEPVRDAGAGFLGNVAWGLAGLITLVGFAIPWLVVLVPLGWLALRWLRARRARRTGG